MKLNGMVETPFHKTIDPVEKVPSDCLPRVLFLYPVDTTFVRSDFELLRRVANVTAYHFRGPRDYPSLLARLLSADTVYCWFALGFAAFAVVVARLLGRRALVVAGGWDVVAMPEIGYGRLVSLRGRLVARIAFCFANEILAFSDWSAAQIRRLSPRARIRRVYLSVDAEAFLPAHKERMVVCVANVTRENVARKGLRTFVDAAVHLSDVQFFLVGQWCDDSASELRANAPQNVTLTGRLPDRDLKGLLGRAKVYCQPSYTEGFGVAIIEAMASGCIPVVTSAGAIPEVVGETGIFVDYGNPWELAGAIQLALSLDGGDAARTRVVQMFSQARRLTELHNALTGLHAPGLQGGSQPKDNANRAEARP